MSNDSGLFRTRAQLEEQGYALGGDGVFRARGQNDYLQLYEAKLFHQYDHRFATFEGGAGEDKARDTTEAEHADPRYVPTPRYWVPSAEVERALGEWHAPWLLGFRDITNATNERTFISACLPRVGVGHTAPLLLSTAGPQGYLQLMANLNSIPFDFVARQKVGGTHMTYFIVKQLPVMPTETYDRYINGERLAEWVKRRALELTYTSYDMAPLARDLGYDGLPSKWDEARRAELRGELDGLYAHLYGLSRDDFAYILTTFPVLQKNEERRYGEYRTAGLARAAYDALAPLVAAVRPAANLA